MMSEKLQRFTNLMKQVFELDKSELDFGIYRIMNIRKAEIEKFLTVDLCEKVRETLTPFADCDKEKIKQQLAEIEKNARDFGMDPETLSDDNPMGERYHSLKKQLAEGTDLSTLETDVYSALYSFFNRYYEDGDFISKRRYKEGVYAIPYEGEEVKLYWANQDQYYIKTSENFKDYTFLCNEYTVHFRLVDATTEQNNNKESSDSKRTFMLFAEDEENYPGIKTFEYNDETKEFIVRFIFDIPKDKKKKYEEENYTAICEYIVNNQKQLMLPLLCDVSTDKKQKLTFLQKHLKGYIAKNTFDYFIHKNLRGFLTRELDFYIKSEIVQLDELDTENETKVNTYLAKIKAIKRVGKIIINFLAQIEDFQKKLWLKKKFVVDTNWCLTLDKIDESFYPMIIDNAQQIKEWEEIFNLKKYKDYSDKITVDFLKKHKELVIDTRYFDANFKDAIISKLDNIHTQTDGILFHADNYHALSQLEHLKSSIKCIYIDPPFNLGTNGDFLYKTNYLDSSWASMLRDRLLLAYELLRDDGAIFVRCDYHGNTLVRMLLDEIFGKNNYKNEIIINRFQKAADGLTTTTESLFFYSKSDEFKVNKVEKTRQCVFCKKPIEPKWMWSHSAGEGDQPRYFTVDGERVLLYPPKGRHWTNKQEVIDELEKAGRIRIDHTTKYTDSNGNKIPYIPEKLQSDSVDLDNNWTDIPGYEFGVFTKEKFSTQNSADLLKRVIEVASNENDIVMDFFMGSGTTQAVAQSLNRRWIGVEMGEYFYRTPLKRLKSGIQPNKIIKYMRLESYEDALSNIEFEKEDGQLSLLLGDEYMINYMLDIETKGSLLNIEAFKNPFDYKMKITEKNECKERNIDIPETFNYLIGISVTSQSSISYFCSKPAVSPEYDGAVELHEDIDGAYAFRQIKGALPDGRRALVIWRTVTDDIIASNAALDAYFMKYHLDPVDRKFDIIFVNGDSNLENLRASNETWKVQITEIEFNKRMFKEI